MVNGEMGTAPPGRRGEQPLKVGGLAESADHRDLSLVWCRVCRAACARTCAICRRAGRCRSDLRQALAALGTACVDHGTAATGLHADEKTVRAGAAGLRGLVGALHGCRLVCGGRARPVVPPWGDSLPTVRKTANHTKRPRRLSASGRRSEIAPRRGPLSPPWQALALSHGSEGRRKVGRCVQKAADALRAGSLLAEPEEPGQVTRAARSELLENCG